MLSGSGSAERTRGLWVVAGRVFSAYIRHDSGNERARNDDKQATNKLDEVMGEGGEGSLLCGDKRVP